MANTVGLALYSMVIKRPEEAGSHKMIPIKHCPQGGKDVLKLVSGVLERRMGSLIRASELPSAATRTMTDRAMRIVSVEAAARHGLVCGRCETGEYGRTGKIREVEHGSVAFKKGKNHSDMEPIFYCCSFQEDRSQVLVALQRSGHAGIKTVLEAILKEELLGFGYTLTMNPVAHESAFEKNIQAGIPQSCEIVTYVKKKEDRAFLDGFTLFGERIPPGAKLKIQVSRTAKSRLDTDCRDIWDLVKTKACDRLLEIKGLDDVEEEDLVVKIGNKRKKLCLTDPERATVTIDVTDQIREGDDGHPSFESIKKAAVELIDEYENILI